MWEEVRACDPATPNISGGKSGGLDSARERVGRRGRNKNRLGSTWAAVVKSKTRRVMGKKVRYRYSEV